MNKSNFKSKERKAMKAHNFMNKEKGIGGGRPNGLKNLYLQVRYEWKEGLEEQRGGVMCTCIYIRERMEVGRSNERGHYLFLFFYTYFQIPMQCKWAEMFLL